MFRNVRPWRKLQCALDQSREAIRNAKAKVRGVGRHNLQRVRRAQAAMILGCGTGCLDHSVGSFSRQQTAVSGSAEHRHVADPDYHLFGVVT